MYSAILVRAWINFAPPKRYAGFTIQDELRKRAGISGKDRQSTGSVDREGLVGQRSGMAKYYDHVFDLRTLALFSKG
jgi:hypothetical protein